MLFRLFVQKRDVTVMAGIRCVERMDRCDCVVCQVDGFLCGCDQCRVSAFDTFVEGLSLSLMAVKRFFHLPASFPASKHQTHGGNMVRQ